MNRVDEILDFLEENYKDARCELNYNKDYELLIAVMLSAQTTDKMVNKVTKVLFERFDTLEKLKNADLEEIKSIIREIGTFNKKAAFIKDIATVLVDRYSSIMPTKRCELETLPGVGRKTVSVVLSELGISKEFAVDTHVERVSKRLGLARNDDNVLEVEKKLKRKIRKEEWVKRHHQFIFFGRYKCKAINPLCSDCSLGKICKYKKIIRAINDLRA